ncbi:MAG: UDP-N-acetylglucosamine pyrophosphorylase [Ruminococcaceae bacterium]|nr:UDP-N-acetylglucosamine pyrophosphorylase [Oscillospiraceae bacterium]
MIKTTELYDLTKTAASPLLEKFEYPWEALSGIKDFIIGLGQTLDPAVYEKKGENVWIAKSATVAPSALINGPCIIMEDAEVRHCAFVRGSALIGKGALLGNSCEIKNAILFDGAQIPHFNYIGDSIVGYKSHFGAGSITSNIKSDKTNIVIRFGEKSMETGLRKIGGIVGDNVEIGCNAVLCPGTVIGKNSNVYPLVRVRGVIPANSICKDAGVVVTKR